MDRDQTRGYRDMMDSDVVKTATTRFDRARTRAFWKRVLALLTGRKERLVKWDQALEELFVQGQSSPKLTSVPLDRIVGTVGRYEDFDRAFLPTRDGLSKRWYAIDRAYEQGIALPPIQLYQIGDAYFCLDGHHRISVARQRGIHSLEAQVIEVKTRVPVSGDLDVDELAIRGEYARFLKRTRLDELRPKQRIEFTVRGGYHRLLEHIALHESKTGNEAHTPSPQAICDWYDHTYLPLVEIIRDHNILADFPDRSEADLYLWLMDHQAELRAQCGPDVDTERVAEHYAERHGRHLLSRATSALHDWLSQDACELVT
jgi:hypothetical protein